MAKRTNIIGFVTGLWLVFMIVSNGNATMFMVGDRPLNVLGLVSQNVQVGVHDKFDTKRGINSSIYTLLLEGDYSPSENLKLFGSFVLSGDWAYNIHDSNNTWKRRQFDESQSELALDTEYWRIITCYQNRERLLPKY